MDPSPPAHHGDVFAGLGDLSAFRLLAVGDEDDDDSFESSSDSGGWNKIFEQHFCQIGVAQMVRRLVADIEAKGSILGGGGIPFRIEGNAALSQSAGWKQSALFTPSGQQIPLLPLWRPWSLLPPFKSNRNWSSSYTVILSLCRRGFG